MLFEKNYKLKCIIASIINAVIVYGFISYLIQLQISKIATEEKLQNAMYGNLLRSEVDRELNSLLFISNGMASYLATYQNELKPDKINLILKDLWHRAKHVRNLGVAVGSVMTYVYPLENNSKVLGVDFKTLKHQWPKIEQAIVSRKGVLDGPLELIQGGRAIVYRYPIFLNDKYWGFISTVIDTDDFLNSAFKTVNDRDRIFAIRVAENNKVFYGNPALFNDSSAFKAVSLVPNGKWEWAIKNVESSKSNHTIILRVFAIVFSLMSGILVYLFLKERFQLTTDAMLDSLTDLPNHRFLNIRMDAAFSNCKKQNKLMAIAAIDVDYFKKINDTYGHDFGDEVLKVVAQTIKSSLRKSDIVSRTGGDEFIILLEDISTKSDLIRIAEKLNSSFRHPFSIFNEKIPIQLSIGISVYNPNTHTSIKQLLKEADIALYESKGKGRNTFSIYTL